LLNLPSDRMANSVMIVKLDSGNSVLF